MSYTKIDYSSSPANAHNPSDQDARKGRSGKGDQTAGGEMRGTDGIGYSGLIFACIFLDAYQSGT